MYMRRLFRGPLRVKPAGMVAPVNIPVAPVNRNIADQMEADETPLGLRPVVLAEEMFRRVQEVPTDLTNASPAFCVGGSLYTNTAAMMGPFPANPAGAAAPVHPPLMGENVRLVDDRAAPETRWPQGQQIGIASPDLVSHLRLHALFRPRTAELRMALKARAMQFLKDFQMPYHERYYHTATAVALAMVPDDIEIVSLQHLEAIDAQVRIKKVNEALVGTGTATFMGLESEVHPAEKSTRTMEEKFWGYVKSWQDTQKTPAPGWSLPLKETDLYPAPSSSTQQ